MPFSAQSQCHIERLPSTQVQVYLEEPVEGDDVVEFRLLYWGALPGASKTNTRASVKHSIRQKLHPQLRQLWKNKSTLNTMATRFGCEIIQDRTEIDWSKPGFSDKVFNDGINARASNWQRNGYRFLPLVTDEFCLRCSLDILFLRPEAPGLLINSGDLDSRLKTVFDALRMPKSREEAGGQDPQHDEDPFYVLLEDDKLISEIKVTTDQLLLLPAERELRPNDAFLVINVKLLPTYPSPNNWAFEVG
jgi:hypothetical protein